VQVSGVGFSDITNVFLVINGSTAGTISCSVNTSGGNGGTTCNESGVTAAAVPANSRLALVFAQIGSSFAGDFLVSFQLAAA
jgi:hypothetical protein